MPDSDDVWRRVEANKRVAQSYLNEHTHETPKIRELPTAVYEVVRKRDYIAGERQVKCLARARIETNLYGNAVGNGGVDTLVCVRPMAHDGRHISAPILKPLFRRGWKVASWTY